MRGGRMPAAVRGAPGELARSLPEREHLPVAAGLRAIFQIPAPLASLLDPGRGGSPAFLVLADALGHPGQLGGAPADAPVESAQLAVRSSQLRAAAGCCPTRVPGVELREGGHRRCRLAPPGKLLADGGQLVQGSPGRPDRRVI